MAIQQTQVLPAPFIEAAGKTYLADLQSAIGGLKTADLTKTMGRQFVAPTSAITQEAQALRGGLGTFAPFLQTAAATTGPTAYQQFMSPYQQDVIDKTLTEFDKQAQAGITNIGLQAAKSGNLGGGREGVMRSEYQTKSDMDRAMLQAKLLQSGFGQAQQAAQTAFGQQRNLAQDVSGLGGLQYKLQGQDVGRLGSAGAIQQAQAQAEADALREANRLRAYEPYERLGYLGSGLSSMLAGMPGGYSSTVMPDKDPLTKALGIASVGGQFYKDVFGGNTS